MDENSHNSCYGSPSYEQPAHYEQSLCEYKALLLGGDEPDQTALSPFGATTQLPGQKRLYFKAVTSQIVRLFRS